jgi:DNA polymerase III delta prime subunit
LLLWLFIVPDLSEVSMLCLKPTQCLTHVADADARKRATKAQESYDAISDQIMKSDGQHQVRSICESLETWCNENKTPTPFLLLDGPSGVGKTQLAWTILKNLQDRRNWLCGYVTMTRSSTAQDIYLPFQKLSAILDTAVTSDINKHFPARSSGSFPDCTNIVDSTSFQTVRFFSRIFFENDSVDTIAGLRELVKGKNVVFFFDEVPRISDDSSRFVAFARNLLRLSSIIPVLLGTDSSAVNMTGISGHSSSAVGDRGLWARIVADFPSFIPPPSISSELCRIFLNGNSRVNTFFLSKLLFDSLDHADAIPAETMWRLCREVMKDLDESKPALRHEEGLRGFFCMVNAAYYTHEADYTARQKKRLASDLSHQSCVSSLVVSHFADLSARMVETNRINSGSPIPRIMDIQLSPKGFCHYPSNSQASVFEPLAVFRPTVSSSLLYLVLMSQEMFGDLSVCDMMEILGRSGTASWDPSNNTVRTTTGLVQESKLSTALIVASHIDGFTGTSSLRALQRMIWDIGLREKGEEVDFGIIPNFQIPFLAPANQTWDPLLSTYIQGCYLGSIERTSNFDGIDCLVKDQAGKIVLIGEAKDRDQLKTSDIRGIVRKGINHKACLSIVFTRTLQNTYFTGGDVDGGDVGGGESPATKKPKKAKSNGSNKEDKNPPYGKTWSQFLDHHISSGIKPLLVRLGDDLRVTALFPDCLTLADNTFGQSTPFCVFLFIVTS